jgi:peptidoglycan/LPS O-acetylase OafA/YrhL
VEEQFYLTLPLVVRFVSRRRLVQLVLGVVAAAALFRFLMMTYLPAYSYGAYLLTPCRADALGMGVLVALAARDRRIWHWLRENRALLYAGAGTLFLILLGIDLSSFEPGSATLYGAEYSLLAAFYASVLLIAITAEDWFVRTLFCNKLLMKLGLIAYGTYLIHRSTLQLAHLWLGASGIRFSTGLWAASMLLGVGGAIALAQISWTWFEKPMVRRGHQYKY